jgi:hypothetical protein
MGLAGVRKYNNLRNSGFDIRNSKGPDLRADLWINVHV